MMFDMNMMFSYKQKLTESTESTHGYDRLLNGDDLQRVMTLNVFVNGVNGTGTIAVSLKTSADGSTNWTEIYSSPVITAAAGKIVSVPLPRGMRRYLKLDYTVAGVTDVTVTAGITDAEEADITLNAQKRDMAAGAIPDLAAQTDALNNA